MEITIDFVKISNIFNLSPLELIWYLIAHGGWIILVIGLLVGLFYIHLGIIQGKYIAGKQQHLLAVDIPKDNEQSLVAMEELFNSLHGMYGGPTMVDKYVHGETQPRISLEIISIEGHIQFLVRTFNKFKDMIEAAIYAQYPEAEITEVEDYVDLIPDNVHTNESEYRVWGTDLKLAKNSGYPIKTYKDFVDPNAKENAFIDPMASLLEAMSKIGKGEFMGMQIIFRPDKSTPWRKDAYKIIKKLIGDKTPTPKTLSDKLVDVSVKNIGKFSEGVYKMWGDIKDKDERDPNPNMLLYLTPGQKRVLEKMEIKVSKINYACSMRYLYMAHNDIFRKGMGINAIMGSLNQFQMEDINTIKPDGKYRTDAAYLFAQQRVNYRIKHLVKRYKNRMVEEGPAEFFLSSEELATLYHFPVITVKAPLLKRTEAKKGAPPVSLPLDVSEGEQRDLSKKLEAVQNREQKIKKNKDKKIKELYTISQSLPGYDFDEDYFEERFAKRKDLIKPQQESASKKDAPPTNLPIIEQ